MKTRSIFRKCTSFGIRHLYATAIIAMTIVGCSESESPAKNQNTNNDNTEDTTGNDPVVVDAPCDPDTNTNTYINGQVLTYYSVYAGDNGVLYGEYGVSANGTASDLRVEFIDPPETGVYVTTSNPTTFDWKDNNCMVSGTFGGTFSYHYVASAGDSVYVNKLGDNKYHIDFCDMYFRTSQSSIEFESAGNLTTK